MAKPDKLKGYPRPHMSLSVTPEPIEPFVLYQSELLSAYAERLIHGFTGRPLDLKAGNGAVESLCARTGLNARRLHLLRQEHTDVFRLNDHATEQTADAVIVTETGVPAIVRVADCVPILLYDPVRHVGAAIHAGWRGVAQAIAPKTATALITDHNACPSEIRAVIGPAIRACCYEVSEEVATAVEQTLPEASASCRKPGQNGRPHLDLQEVNRLQLLAMGLHRIEVVDACTRCETERLWSYRRGDAGRQAAFLQLN